MTDDGTEQEPSSLSGDVAPSEPGEWLTLEDAGARLGIDRKAVYRRIRRGTMRGKKAPGAAHLLVWFPSEEPGSPREEQAEAFPERSLSVPEQGERFLELLDRATAALGRQVQELTEEREQARRERDEEQAHATALAAERDQLQQRLDDLARRPWWRWWRD